jgi:hypothetical protein
MNESQTNTALISLQLNALESARKLAIVSGKIKPIRIEIATEDIKNYLLNGASMNPYSSNRARLSWQNGFDGKPWSYMDWFENYQRGQTAAELFFNMMTWRYEVNAT